MDTILGTNDDLVDVTKLPLRRLLSSDDSVIDNAVRRVIADLDRGGVIIAGFTSAPAEKTGAVPVAT